MNTDKVTIYPIPAHTTEWYDFRRNGIGGSEAAIIMGLSEYGNTGKMYYEKLGLFDPFIPDNQAMFWGRELEEEIAAKWQYYDGTPLGYMENYAKKNIIRRCRRINGYAVNSDYPWLFGSLDRVINRKGGFKLTTGEPLEEEAGLEIKTIENFVADKWEGGLPVYHIIQVHVYMAIMGIDYFEIAVLKNGRYFEVYPIDRNEKLVQDILLKTKHFWYNHVAPARPYAANLLKAQALNDKAGIEYNSSMVQKYEPSPVAGESYRDFLSERFKKVHEVVKAPSWVYAVARRHKEMIAVVKYFEGQKSLCANIMAKFMVDNQTSKAEFDEGKGHIWLAQRPGGVHFVDNRVKASVDELRAIDTLSKIKIDILK